MNVGAVLPPSVVPDVLLDQSAQLLECECDITAAFVMEYSLFSTSRKYTL